MIRSDHPICFVAPDVDVPVRGGDNDWRVRTVASLDEMHTELKAIADRAPQGLRTLDLIGHATRDHSLLRFGDTAIDMFRPSVARLFAAIRAEELLQELGITAVRLLGCSTALTPAGQRTMQRLARTLELPVFGSTKALLHAHYTVDGFNPKFAHVLIEASQLPNPPRRLSAD
jgi:hypothetical protein